MNFNEQVWELCKKIPKGKVATYRELAKVMNTKAYQAIGGALKRNPNAPKTPCHRVVKTDGSLGGYCGEMNSPKKIALLRKEGVEVRNGMIVDFEKKKVALI